MTTNIQALNLVGRTRSPCCTSPQQPTISFFHSFFGYFFITFFPRLWLSFIPYFLSFFFSIFITYFLLFFLSFLSGSPAVCMFVCYSFFLPVYLYPFICFYLDICQVMTFCSNRAKQINITLFKIV